MAKIFAFIVLFACLALAFAAEEEKKQENLETAEGRYYGGYGGYGGYGEFLYTFSKSLSSLW